VKTRTSGLTLVEILVVVGIIAILAGLLVPAVHTVQKMARETKQKAQLTAIEMGLAAFKNDYGDYPSSTFNDPLAGGRGDYCGAQKLAEALLGWDLLGYHPSSAWRADGLAVNGLGQPIPNTVYHAPDTLQNRRGRYVEAETANPFFLGRGANWDGVFWDTTGDWGGGNVLAPQTYVLCDVFPVRERRVVLPDGKVVSPGTPILYYKANPASKILVPGLNEPLVQPELRIYNARDNRALVRLGRAADYAKPLTARRSHKLDPVSYLLDAQETLRLANPGDPMFQYFYQLYIRDFKIQARVWPHRPDSYLLISAGADGLYGTDDDITNFGR
jgi:type II secretory pathway pseudopilin PulG